MYGMTIYTADCLTVCLISWSKSTCRCISFLSLSLFRLSLSSSSSSRHLLSYCRYHTTIYHHHHLLHHHTLDAELSTMGTAASTPVVPARSISKREPRRNVPREAPPSSPPSMSLDEKFDAFRINDDDDDDQADNSSSSKKPSATTVTTRHIFPSPSSNISHIDTSNTQAYVLHILQDPKNRLGLSALSSHNPATILEKPATLIRDTQYFNVKIPFEGSPVTNQRSSGRCWIFAATNVFRVAIQQKYNIPRFELSQAYLFFWDKVEKANYFLESILDTVDGEDVDGRLVSALNASPVGDGGQWVCIMHLWRSIIGLLFFILFFILFLFLAILQQQQK